MSSQSYLRIIDPRLAASLPRSYYTALNVIGDNVSAEALVMEAIESLDPENVTGETLRDGVVAAAQLLVDRGKVGWRTRRVMLGNAGFPAREHHRFYPRFIEFRVRRLPHAHSK